MIGFFSSGLLVNRPPVDPLLEDQVYFATDEKTMYQQEGGVWVARISSQASAEEASLRKLGAEALAAAPGNHTHPVDVKRGESLVNYGDNNGGATYGDLNPGEIGTVVGNAALQVDITPGNLPSEYIALPTFMLWALGGNLTCRVKLYNSTTLVRDGSEISLVAGQKRFFTGFFGPNPWPQGGAHSFRARVQYISGTGGLRVTPVSFLVSELYPLFQAQSLS